MTNTRRGRGHPHGRGRSLALWHALSTTRTNRPGAHGRDTGPRSLVVYHGGTGRRCTHTRRRACTPSSSRTCASGPDAQARDSRIDTRDDERDSHYTRGCPRAIQGARCIGCLDLGWFELGQRGEHAGPISRF